MCCMHSFQNCNTNEIRSSVRSFVPFNSLVHFLDCFAWFGSLRSRRHRRRCCFIFRSFISFVVNVLSLFSFQSIFIRLRPLLLFKHRKLYGVCCCSASKCSNVECCSCCCCYSLIALRFHWKYSNRIFISLFNVNVHFRGVNFLVLCNVSSWNRGPLFRNTHARCKRVNRREKMLHFITASARSRRAMAPSIHEVNAFYCRDCSGR